jgi:hypothetical protein
MISIEERLESRFNQRKSWAGPESAARFDELHSFSEPEPFRSQEFLPTVINDGYIDPEEPSDLAKTDGEKIATDRPNSSALWDEKTVLSFGESEL